MYVCIELYYEVREENEGAGCARIFEPWYKERVGSSPYFDSKSHYLHQSRFNMLRLIIKRCESSMANYTHVRNTMLCLCFERFVKVNISET